MANRPTINDVARAAGVSATTVDRALNGRAVVRDETLRKIADAAQRLGYHGRAVLQGRLTGHLPQRRLGFVLLKRTQEFYRNFEAEIAAEAARATDVQISTDIRYASSQSPDEFAALLTALGRSCDAIGCIAVNDTRLDPVVQALKDKGVAVFAVLNDFAQGIRTGYVGLNNMKAGRVAAWMMTTALHEAGPLAVFVGGNRWHGHDLREVGFRSRVRETARGFTLLDTRVNLETRQVTYEATLDLLHRHPDLRGLYVAGGGMEGAIAALRDAHATPRVALVVHELTAESRAALTDGYATLVIATPLQALCRDLVAQMLRAVDTGATGADAAATQHFLDPRLVLPEML